MQRYSPLPVANWFIIFNQDFMPKFQSAGPKCPAKALCVPHDVLCGCVTNSQLSWSRNKIHSMYSSCWLHGMHQSV